MEFWDYWLFYTQKYGEKKQKTKTGKLQVQRLSQGNKTERQKRASSLILQSLRLCMGTHTCSDTHTGTHAYTTRILTQTHTHEQMRTHTCSHLKKVRKKESSIWIT